MFVVFCIQDQGSNNFENDIIKLSVNKAKLIGLWAINCDTIQQVLIFKFALRPEKIFRPFEKRASEPNHRRRLKRLGSFSIDDGNGRENQPRPQGFSLKKWVGRELALASAGHVSPRTP